MKNGLFSILFFIIFYKFCKNLTKSKNKKLKKFRKKEWEMTYFYHFLIFLKNFLRVFGSKNRVSQKSAKSEKWLISPYFWFFEKYGEISHF